MGWSPRNGDRRTVAGVSGNSDSVRAERTHAKVGGQPSHNFQAHRTGLCPGLARRICVPYTARVTRLHDLIATLTGFERDEGNSTKSWERHQVTRAEQEQAFFNRPVFVCDARSSAGEIRYTLLGRTNNGRLLSVVFTVRRGLARLVSGRPMSRQERIEYAKDPQEAP